MSGTGDLSASLVLRRGALARVGLERIALVEAVAELGSISAAAKRLALSYKGAWDAVQALNNLFDAPLIAASAGGKSGGAAQVTPRGHAVIKAFRDMEREVGAALSRLEAGLAAEEGSDLFWSLGLRTSARNALRGVVVALVPAGVTVEVRLDLGGGLEIASVITRRSAEELGLAVGRPAVALIKSSFVRLSATPPAASGDNRLSGQVFDREDGEAASEVVVALAEGKTLVATVARDAAGLAPGATVHVLIAPSDVILAVD
ncbi:TOBE domain-containing protein [Caulobacter hibisci]|uniref:TOBE domain-containing protein n=1 Tax=Caulobacter hibisci TaxID=2035993 RepID=A0ABS0SXH6_9CAUL|nr:TOBE domain-containing protein [Caulobacter hibisci]MBI1684347.1 TOBE domain-containing protein [Caulobacter hibisci]